MARQRIPSGDQPAARSNAPEFKQDRMERRVGGGAPSAGTASLISPMAALNGLAGNRAVFALLRGPSVTLAPGARLVIEAGLDADFSNVHVHQGPEAAVLADAMDAQAITIGRDIFFGSDQYRPETETGRRLLAHELAHVVQQTQRPRAARNSSESSAETEAVNAASAVEAGRPATVSGASPVAAQMQPQGTFTSEELRRKREQLTEAATAAGLTQETMSSSSQVPASSLPGVPGGAVRPSAAEMAAKTSSLELHDRVTEPLAEEESERSPAPEGGGRETSPLLETGAGIAYGTVQGVTPGGFLAPSPAPHSKRFEYFRAAGQIATGMAMLLGGAGGEVVGGGLDATGIGVVAGVPINIASAGLVAGGAASVVAGARGLIHAMSMEDDDRPTRGRGGGGGRKQDLRQVDAAAAKARLSPEERLEFGRYLEELKRSGHGGTANPRGDFTWDELLQAAEEFKELFRGRG